MVQDATARWDNTYEGHKQTLVTQATIASNLDEDGRTLSNADGELLRRRRIAAGPAVRQ